MQAKREVSATVGENIKKYFADGSIVFLLLCVYLIINTGLVSDDFSEIHAHRGKNSFRDVFSFSANYEITIPILKLTHGIVYNFVGIETPIIYDFIKIFYVSIAFLLSRKFFSLFHDLHTSSLLAFLIILYPSHDSSVYFYLAQYLTLTLSFYFYAYYLAHNNRFVPAVLASFAASFVSYGSTPVAIGLGFLFIIHKELRKALTLIVPNMIFVVYYIYITVILNIGTKRMAPAIDLFLVVKQFLLQIGTFIDSLLGPSLWLKIYYSLTNLTVLSLIVGTLVISWFHIITRQKKQAYYKKAIASFGLIVFLAMFMFATTGFYPQLAFNLGNRITIYGSILIVYILVLLPLPKKAATVIFGLLIFAILGISDHWKNWNQHQQKVIQNIKSNPQLYSYSDNQTIFVSGNQYSKLGKMSHIEFFSESHVVNSVFNLALPGNQLRLSTLNKRLHYSDGALIDTKYNDKLSVAGYINVYDSEKNILFKLKADDINGYIASLPFDNRHWVQLLDNNSYIKRIVLILMPRLQYAL